MFDYDEYRDDNWNESFEDASFSVSEYLSGWLSWKDTFYVERGW